MAEKKQQFGAFRFFVLERNTGITGVAFGRTDLSIGGIGTTFHALLHRHGPGGPNFQGMPEQNDLHVFSPSPAQGRVASKKTNNKIEKAPTWAPTIPKDAARLGDLGKRVFGPKFPKYEGKNLDFRFSGFPDF